MVYRDPGGLELLRIKREYASKPYKTSKFEHYNHLINPTTISSFPLNTSSDRVATCFMIVPT